MLPDPWSSWHPLNSQPFLRGALSALLEGGGAPHSGHDLGSPTAELYSPTALREGTWRTCVVTLRCHLWYREHLGPLLLPSSGSLGEVASLVTDSWKPSASTLPRREVTAPGQPREGQRLRTTGSEESGGHEGQYWPNEVEGTDLVMGSMATKEDATKGVGSWRGTAF